MKIMEMGLAVPAVVILAGFLVVLDLGHPHKIK